MRPSIIQQERLSSVELNEHDTKLLLCVASGNPKPSYTWKKNGVIIQQHQGSNYTITSAKKEDRGQYTCEAVVSIPELSFTHYASYTVDVKVKCKYQLYSRSDEKFHLGLTGMSTCHLFG